MKKFAVIVAYQPDIRRLCRMVMMLRSSGVRVIIVDNSVPAKPLDLPSDVEILVPGTNVGIASAQNLGINRALAEDAGALIFFDQDSCIEGELLAVLFGALEHQGPKMVSPVFYDERRGFEYPAIRFNRLGIRARVYPSRSKDAVPVSAVISSGCAVNRSALDKIGLMDESLFIDYVDTEWCLRAGKLGIPIEILPQAKMLHSIGDRSLNLGFIRVPVHSAQRRYYRVRNSILLLGMPHVPKLLALRELAFSFVHQAVIMLAVPGRRDYLRYFIRALVDGFRGKTGKM